MDAVRCHETDQTVRRCDIREPARFFGLAGRPMGFLHVTLQWQGIHLCAAESADRCEIRGDGPGASSVVVSRRRPIAVLSQCGPARGGEGVNLALAVVFGCTARPWRI